MPGRLEQPESLSGLGAIRVGWLLTVAVLVLGALTVALVLGFGPLDRLDTTVAGWGYRATYGHHGLSGWWIGVAAYGQPMVLRAALVLIALYFAWKRRWALAIWLVGLTVAENVIAPLTKHLLSRPRPDWLHPITVEHSLSYPSGHAAAAGTFTTAMILLALATLSRGWRRGLMLVFAVLVGFIISMDRIFLGVHYLSDVIGGVLLGAVIVLAGWLLMLRRLRERHTA
ncbi:phosphatase PAP2 family protein [Nocardioides jensenii]|uniref:phosphatase PAP2 family protein n=1 Tax=Nocardioides jensenii TaxID=1843 RepID=UPI0012F71F3E|nr:phosphatase PAP2 family protein [Nocardioides jensenii]